MVSICSLRLVYTFLYTIINDNIMASIVQKKKSFGILWPKIVFFAYVHNLETPSTSLPLARKGRHLSWPLFSLFVSTYYVDDPFLYINLVFVVVVHVLTSSYLLSQPYTKLSILTLLLMQEVFFRICPRLLKKFGMKG